MKKVIRVLFTLGAAFFSAASIANQINEIHLPDGYMTMLVLGTPVDFDASADGRRIVFVGDPDIIPVVGGISNAGYLLDRDANTLSLINAGIPAEGTAFRDVLRTRITADGRYASFVGIGDPEGIISLFTKMIWVRDLETTDIFLGSAVDGGGRTAQIDLNGGMPGRIARNGRFVSFASQISDFVPDDANGKADVFVHDLQTLSTERISLDPQGNELLEGSVVRAISPNGQLVYFYSKADFTPDDSDVGRGLYVFDRQNRSMKRLLTEINGSIMAVSGNSRYAVYTAAGTYVYDAIENRSTPLADSVGLSIKAQGSNYAMSDSGRYVVFKIFPFFPLAEIGRAQLVMVDRTTGEIVRLDTNGTHISLFSGTNRVTFVENPVSVIFQGRLASPKTSDTLLLFEAIPGLANIGVDMSGPSSVSSGAGQTANFQFVVSNDGSEQLTDGYLIFETPPNVVDSSFSVSGVECFNYKFHQFQCVLPRIVAGTSFAFGLAMAVGGLPDGSYQIKYRAGSTADFDVSPTDNNGSKILNVGSTSGGSGSSGGGGALSFYGLLLLFLLGTAKHSKGHPKTF